MGVRQLWIKTTKIGRTEIEHHTVNWAKETALTDDRIVKAEFDVLDDGGNSITDQLLIEWRNFTDFDTTLCLNANGITPGNKYFAAHTVYLESGRKLRRTVRVIVVQR